MTATVAPITCPKCQGKMWSNVGTKKNPRQPDYKCADKEGCGHGVWLEPPGKPVPANGNGAAAPPARGAFQPTPPTGPPPGPSPAPPTRAPIPPAAPLKGQAQIDQERKDLSARFFSLHRACVQHVLTSDVNALKVAGLTDTAETATARINTLFDTACREGLAK